MDPNFKLLFDEMKKFNARFDEQSRRFDEQSKRFDALELSITEQSTSTIARIDVLESSHASSLGDLSRRVADLEAAPVDPQPLAVSTRLASLEACYADRDAEFSKWLADLEGLRVDIRAADDDRVASLEATTASLAAWRPDMEDLVFDVRRALKSIEAPAHARCSTDCLTEQRPLLLRLRRPRSTLPGSLAISPSLGPTLHRLHGIQDPVSR